VNTQAGALEPGCVQALSNDSREAEGAGSSQEGG
jgi:hypothetical protein